MSGSCAAGPRDKQQVEQPVHPETLRSETDLESAEATPEPLQKDLRE